MCIEKIPEIKITVEQDFFKPPQDESRAPYPFGGKGSRESYDMIIRFLGIFKKHFIHHIQLYS